MAKTTPIQWCDSTVNITTGCDGCELHRPGASMCYAANFTKRFGRSNKGLADDFDIVELAPGRMKAAVRWSDLRGQLRASKPWLDGSPRVIFVSDMSDALSAGVSFDYLHAELVEPVMSEAGQRHAWAWLTKRPGRMAEFSAWLKQRGVPWPTNLWAGCSVTKQATVSRVDHLLRVGDDDTTRFVSLEPQFEPVDFGDLLEQLDWVIQGGASGTTKYPFNLRWADQLREQCRAGVAYFLKQLGRHAVEDGQRVQLKDTHGGDWHEWPSRLRVREMPACVGPRTKGPQLHAAAGGKA